MQTVCKSIGALALLFIAMCASAQPSPDFTGHWQQRNAATQRQLEIEQNGKSLLVKTINTGSQGTRRLDVKYEIGGSAKTYTGLDGDEFHSSVHWDGNDLVFDIIEHEDGKDIPQKAVWKLSANGSELQIDRETSKTGKLAHSLTTYVREH